jgi:transposase
VWEHPALCRPTAASSKHASEPRRSGLPARSAGNGPPSCLPRAAPRRRSPANWTSRAKARADGTPAGKPQGHGAAEPRSDRATAQVPDSALEQIEQALLEGALAHGFTTDVWTLDRITVVIQGLTGVQLSNPSVWRLLRGRLGWSVQRPQRQAKERDEEAIQHWVAHEWPRIKKGQPQNRPGSSSSTSQASR